MGHAITAKTATLWIVLVYFSISVGVGWRCGGCGCDILGCCDVEKEKRECLLEVVELLDDRWIIDGARELLDATRVRNVPLSSECMDILLAKSTTTLLLNRFLNRLILKTSLLF